MSFWKNQHFENQSIKYNAFVSSVQQLGLMYQEDIKSGKLNLMDYMIIETKPLFPIKEKQIKKGSGLTAQIVSQISIINLAKEYGFKIKGNKAICKFHDDKDPSLVFNVHKGFFKCFGCGVKGNIIEFLFLCKKHNLSKEDKQ